MYAFKISKYYPLLCYQWVVKEANFTSDRFHFTDVLTSNVGVSTIMRNRRMGYSLTFGSESNQKSVVSSYLGISIEQPTAS